MSRRSSVDDRLMCEIDGNHLTAAAVIGEYGLVRARFSAFLQSSTAIGFILSFDLTDNSFQMISRRLIACNGASFQLERSLVEKLLPLLKRCKSIRSLEQIHAQTLVNSIRMPMPNYLLSKMIDLKDFAYSVRFFSEVPTNSYAFNVMIRGFAATWQRFELAVEFFARMNNLGVKPDNFTLPFVFMSCWNLLNVTMGMLAHSEALKLGLMLDFHVVHSLITMYSRCGEIKLARNAFDEMPRKDLVSWNSIISGYSKSGLAGDAVEMFRKMKEEGFEPNEMTLVSVLASCGDLGDSKLGKQIEDHVMGTDTEMNSFVGSALINMYAKSGELESAKRIFHYMERKDIVTWNAMISGFAQNGEAEETISLFDSMMRNGRPEPNEITLIAVLSACALLGSLEIGKRVEEYASARGFKRDIYVATALVDMYSKCGDLESASKAFDGMPRRNKVSWNAVISAHAFNGRPRESLALFRRMLDEEKDIRPDDITFVGVLSACVHGGLVDEGRRWFDRMDSSFGLTPKVEHYSCMVDLLSRAGLVSEAWDFIQRMPRKPDEILLGSLLVACQKAKNADIGERVSELLLEMEPSNSGNYVISSKIYADVKRWHDCAEMRRTMKQKGISKTPGRSWIETDGLLREFHAGDLLVDDARRIRHVLGLLYEDMLGAGNRVEIHIIK
ncbi:hypothetical protein M569_09392 [Genlisea aurea]|uniref:Pentatricopeptide repeat-containing protein n=1 Tax=Genlisea aurea TaxID=192259 RepID=S8CEY4_9LAMI|nr:hypothetical protein M569_09392 [Genlisea aurea]